jgi:bla regulator protein BlaR1
MSKQSGSKAAVPAGGILNVCKLFVESSLRCGSGVSEAHLKKRSARITAKRLGQRLIFRRKLNLSAAGILSLALPVAFGALQATEGQAQTASAGLTAAPEWQTKAGGKMAFEVASIRQSKPEAFTPPNFPLDDGDSFGSFDPRGHFKADFPLIVYIMFAYKLRLNGEQISSLLAPLPKWVATDFFDVNAKVEGNPTKDQMRLMVQSMLADRFKLAIHFETQQVPALALVLDKPGKTGPKLRPHAEGPPCDAPTPSPATNSAKNQPDVFPPVCEVQSLEQRPSNTFLLGSRDTTIQRIATALPDLGRLGRPVVDETGLTGNFDFTLEWTPEPNSPAPAAPVAQSDLLETSFLEALKEQLGLKLRSTKAPMAVLIIDHIERPSEN